MLLNRRWVIVDKEQTVRKREEKAMFKEKMFNAELADEVSQIPDDITKEPGMEQAFAEMYQILKHCDQEITSCIPDKFMQMLKKYRDPDWSGELDFSKSLNNMELLDKTRNLIHLVYRDFLCSESERKELIEEGKRVAAENGEIYLTESLYDMMDLMD